MQYYLLQGTAHWFFNLRVPGVFNSRSAWPLLCDTKQIVASAAACLCLAESIQSPKLWACRACNRDPRHEQNSRVRKESSGSISLLSEELLWAAHASSLWLHLHNESGHQTLPHVCQSSSKLPNRSQRAASEHIV